MTILAIAASGAAITGIAIKVANDERKDSLDASAGRVRLPLDQGFGLRFWGRGRESLREERYVRSFLNS